MNKKQLIVGGVIFVNLIFLCVALAQPDLKVEGIFLEEKGQSYAIVNGEVVKAGSKINGAEIIEITKDSVKFKYENDFFLRRMDEGLDVQGEKATTSLEQYRSRFKKTKIFLEDQERERQELIEERDRIEKEHYLECAEKSDDYYEAAIIYELSEKCREAVEALQESVNYGKQALLMSMDDAASKNMDSRIQYRKKELERIKRECK